MTTPDPAALKEALAEIGPWLTFRPVDDRSTVLISVLTDAARWALDLIEGGKEVWWCDDPGGEDEPGVLSEPCAGGDRCGKRLLVEP